MQKLFSPDFFLEFRILNLLLQHFHFRNQTFTLIEQEFKG
ncbi:hypothetical protein LEP1GSC070_1299 [Leptospira santarosai str. AIM]|nr:hypothetical protein LEP1GSC070_1299 [Leptospira santarosai str. AIM]